MLSLSRSRRRSRRSTGPKRGITWCATARLPMGFLGAARSCSGCGPCAAWGFAKETASAKRPGASPVERRPSGGGRGGARPARRLGGEIGLQVTVVHEGRLVVDAVSGVADQRTGEPVSASTLFFAASTGKGVASTVAHVLVERGKLAYDQRVADVWRTAVSPPPGVPTRQGSRGCPAACM